MAPVSQRLGGVRMALLAVAGMSAALALVPGSAALAQGDVAVSHRIGCVLIKGHLYLGSPGAGSHAKFVICAIQFDQVRPRSDGIIVVLRQARHRSAYSILPPRLPVRPVGRSQLRWRHHPGSATIRCALAGGRLYLGSAGPRRRRRAVACSVRFYQLAPSADGVVVVLAYARHKSEYSVVLRRLPHHPSGYIAISWLA